MLNKIKILMLVTMLGFAFISCTNAIDSPYDRDESYTFEKLNSFTISLDDSEEIIATFSYEEKLAIINKSSNLFISRFFDMNTGELLNTISHNEEWFIPYDMVMCNDYIVFIGKDAYDENLQFRVYSFNGIELSRNDLPIKFNLYEESLEISNDKLLINLEDKSTNLGQTMIFDLTDLHTKIYLPAYDISTFVMDTSKEYVYGGKNTIVDDLIVMSSIDYVLDNNGVGIYSVEDGELLYNTNEFYDGSCSVIGADVYNNYVSVKTTCNGNNQLNVFDINDKNSNTKIDFPYEFNNYKVKAINQEYIVITNVNYDEQAPKILYSKIDKNDLKEVPLPSEETSLYGASIYMLEEFLVIYTTDYKIYNFDLKEEVYRDVEYFDGNTYCLGFINQFLLFGDDIYIYGYNIIENHASGSFEEDDSLFAYHLGDNFYVNIFRDRIDVYNTMLITSQ